MARAAQEWTQADVRRQLAEPGPWEVSVGGVPGLVLRRGAQASAYAMRGRLAGETRQRTWTVAGAEVLLSSVRARASVAREMALRGEDPRAWLDEQAGRVSAAKVAEPVAPAAPAGWTWTHAVAEYLVREVSSKAAATRRDYRTTLLHPVVTAMAGQVSEVTAAHLQSLQNAFADQGKKVMARKSVVIVRGCLKWCAGRPESGFTRAMLRDAADLDLVRPARRTEEEREDRVPTLDEVAQVMWRLNDAAVPAGVRLACAVLVLTGQRVASLLGAEAGHLADDAWRIPASLMKSKRSHTLPLPPVSAACMRQMAQLVGGSGLLLPQVRLRRAGDQGGRPMAYAALRDAMQAALGHTPHAVRRALGSHGEALTGLSEAAIGAVLDHSTGTVTRRFYAHGDQSAVVGAALAKWESWVIERMGAAAPPGQDWPAFLPRT